MRKLMLLVGACLMLTLASCGIIDELMGVREVKQPDGTVKIEVSDNPPIDAIGGLGAALGVGWLSALLGIGGTIYQKVRRGSAEKKKQEYWDAGRSLVIPLDMILERLGSGESMDREWAAAQLLKWKRRMDAEEAIKALRGK